MNDPNFGNVSNKSHIIICAKIISLDFLFRNDWKEWRFFLKMWSISSWFFAFSIFILPQAMKESNMFKSKHYFLGQKKYLERIFLLWVHMRLFVLLFLCKKIFPAYYIWSLVISELLISISREKHMIWTKNNARYFHDTRIWGWKCSPFLNVIIKHIWRHQDVISY